MSVELPAAQGLIKVIGREGKVSWAIAGVRQARIIKPEMPDNHLINMFMRGNLSRLASFELEMSLKKSRYHFEILTTR